MQQSTRITARTSLIDLSRFRSDVALVLRRHTCGTRPTDDTALWDGYRACRRDLERVCDDQAEFVTAIRAFVRWAGL